MLTSNNFGTTAALAISLIVGATLSAEAQDHRTHRDRPLTISRHTGGPQRGTGIEVRDHGNEIVAWGGFGANGYGYGRPGSEAARRAARNQSVRERTAGLYGYGLDGLGGTFGDEDGRTGGFNNPFYGNGYTGYGGVPTAFAFGPAFANRHVTDSDDEDEGDSPPPSPGALGYSPVSALLDPDE